MPIDIKDIIEVGMAAAGAIWIVANIKGTTGSLAASINRLTDAVDRLDEKLDGHAERLASLEAQKGAPGRRGGK
jgi:hypothetical protein